MEAVSEDTTRKDQEFAQSAMLLLTATSKRVAKGNSNYIRIAIDGDEGRVMIPKKAMML